MNKKILSRIFAPVMALALLLSQQMTAFACSGMELTSSEGDAYWFRTCDMTDGYNVFGENGSYISASYLAAYPAGVPIEFSTGTVTPSYTVIGTSFSDSLALLDGMNSAGLTGGLLMFNEGTSYPGDTAPAGKRMVSGMETVTWVLSQCGSLNDVINLMSNTVVKAIEIKGIPGSGLSATMHLMFTDKSGNSIVLENSNPDKPGEYVIYQSNGVMTNSPYYSTHLANLKAHHDAGENAVIPSGDTSTERFIRLSVQRENIEGGKNIKNEDMLAVGSSQMSRVCRPLVDGQTISYTMYLVAYDIVRGTMYIKPHDSNTWTRLALGEVPTTERTTYPILRKETSGVAYVRNQPVTVNGTTVNYLTYALNEELGNDLTYKNLCELGKVLGFTVTLDPETGVIITQK